MNSSQNNKKITFAWWNTSLSPKATERPTLDEHKKFVLYTIYQLLTSKEVDVLCLCEVSNEDIIFISESIELISSNYIIYNGVINDGRKKFDLCIFYRSDILSFIDSSLISKNSLKTIHAGQEVNFLINETNEPITLYLVHWSSRMYDYESSPNKIKLGGLLRDAVNESREKRNIKYIIVLGDFNEEPFDKGLTEGLYASRDIALVRKTPELLYNPFWRHMVYSDLHPNHDGSDKSCGTYYYRNDQVNSWKTFDQIIFSSDFISGNSWFLNESKTEVFSDKIFMQLIRSTKSKFDHLPIISVIERN
ncbi:endonuclease/exonuclease/phosphatase family protein [Yersinia enterocolitica]|nr:endonuclease/exonuclease/phosphatase family protein [Yersinia enterocolitica]HEI6738444.1 endonuclease/exonuclease/phosphatase family protein [Yersinia enterocolitica]HEI6832160.1 endonuclease/exonuclease/phosphatase family protein [Yersinia enterocolitica]